jgi:hypothetical protein
LDWKLKFEYFFAPGSSVRVTTSRLPGNPGDKEKKMLKKQLTLLLASVLTFPMAMAVFAQETAKAKSKEARWEGRVETTSKEHSTLTVRKVGGSIQKTCAYDSSTKWVSQYHGEKKVTDIDASQVTDGDYVICRGTAEGGVIHSTVISKRLSHSPTK